MAKGVYPVSAVYDGDYKYASDEFTGSSVTVDYPEIDILVNGQSTPVSINVGEIATITVKVLKVLTGMVLLLFAY